MDCVCELGRSVPHASVLNSVPLAQKAVHTWRAELETRDVRPGRHQLGILDAIITRCGDEAVALKKDKVSQCQSEPMLAMIRGVPGSGKSEVIKWARELFIDQLGWKHGVEFICAASMLPMAAHVQKVSVHNVGSLQIDLQPDGQHGGNGMVRERGRTHYIRRYRTCGG